MGVALAYAGAVVGAGFASGQEIYQFFSRHGTAGAVGVLAAGVGFAVLGALALAAGASGTTNFEALLHSLYPRSAVGILSLGGTLFLGIGLVVVTAAAGQAVQDVTGLNAHLMALASLIGILWVARRGADGVMRASWILVPLLLVIAVAVALLSPGRTVAAGAGGWWVSAGLYVSYNLFTGLMVLLGLGPRLAHRREAWWAAGIGAALLTATALVLHRAVLAMDFIGAFPLLDAAHRLGGLWPLLYAAALYAALFTTGVSEAFALSERFGAKAWVALLAWPASWMGFAVLVGGLYPVMGALAVLFWLPLLRWAPRPRL